MIYLFNNTKTPWEISREGEKHLRISKDYGIVKNKDNIKPHYNCGISITSYERDFLEKIKTHVNNFSKTEDVVKICDDNTSVVFGHKDFNPFIKHSIYDGKNRNVLLLSLEINGKIAFDMEMGRNFIIEHILNRHHLSIVLSMEDTIDSEFIISLYDKKEKEIIEYIIFYNQNLDLTCMKNIQRLNLSYVPTPIKIKNNRPKRPTQIIICSVDIYPRLENVIEKFYRNSLQYHNMYTFWDEKLENVRDIIEEIKDKQYNAITLFIDADHYEEEDRYKVILKELTSKFRVVFILLNTGSIVQYKY